MILRRLTNAFRKQDWFTVAVETLIVVLGVFLGLQVNNWNADRTARSAERTTLIRLHEDFEESIAGQSRDIHFLEQQLGDQALILKSLDACAVAPEDDMAFQRGIATLGWINPPRLYRRTIDEVTASGSTDIISNPKVAEELARIIALVEWRATWFDRTIMVMDNYRQKVDPHIRYQMDRTIDNPFVANQRGGVAYNIELLCKDTGLANAISAVSYATAERLEAYRPILEAYVDFSPLVAAELNSRWGIKVSQEAAK
ncbi:MAG: hypothetical protein KKC43_05365 [Alphaproteobacteria bacterium]|jgi:hypothetical protein|nr:hypothetical protein [Alphaproteobacteria bacterium]